MVDWLLACFVGWLMAGWWLLFKRMQYTLPTWRPLHTQSQNLSLLLSWPLALVGPCTSILIGQPCP